MALLDAAVATPGAPGWHDRKSRSSPSPLPNLPHAKGGSTSFPCLVLLQLLQVVRQPAADQYQERPQHVALLRSDWQPSQEHEVQHEVQVLDEENEAVWCHPTLLQPVLLQLSVPYTSSVNSQRRAGRL